MGLSGLRVVLLLGDEEMHAGTHYIHSALYHQSMCLTIIEDTIKCLLLYFSMESAMMWDCKY